MSLSWPIIKVTTVDNCILFGCYNHVENSDITVIHVHGTGGSFYWNSFYPYIATEINKAGYSYLTTNNRGSGVYELEKGLLPGGVSLEIFEDCLKDIDAWIEYAFLKGAKEIILEGHSFGIGKTTFYMAYGKYRDKVKAVIHLGTNGVYQTQQHYLKGNNISQEVYLEEANEFIRKGTPTTLLSDPYALCGYYPASAQTYINFFTPGSNVFKSTQMATKNEGGFRNLINVPYLWILGDKDAYEYLFVPFEEAFKLVKKENPQIIINQLKDSDHGLNGHEEETATCISKFLTKLE